MFVNHCICIQLMLYIFDVFVVYVIEYINVYIYIQLYCYYYITTILKLQISDHQSINSVSISN